MIRKEKKQDAEQISVLLQRAFQTEPHSNQKEHELVEKLRVTDAYIDDLALVYVEQDKIIGFIMYTECFIGDFPVLALGPLAVLPEKQGQGIDTQLMEASIERAKWSGFAAVVVLGHADYYARFGFERADQYGIQAPFDVPLENYRVLPLYKGALTDISGVLTCAQPFYEE